LPNENPPRPAFFERIVTLLHALNLYGAVGLAVFGWAIGALIDQPTGQWVPLWFCAALLIYNADRLRRDPADAFNVPARTAASARLRTASAVTLTLAALVLIGFPLSRRDWVMLYFICAGAIISLAYSIPVLGLRGKDIPLLKTLFPPAVITAAIFGPILFLAALAHPYATHVADRYLMADWFVYLAGLAAWTFTYLLFNMLLCDLRDLPGDGQCGIRSIPVLWGEKGARRLLWALAVGAQLLIAFLIRDRYLERAPLACLALLTGLYQGYLLHATRRPRGERFYEWAVEGLLFLPALALGLTHLLDCLLSE